MSHEPGPLLCVCLVLWRALRLQTQARSHLLRVTSQGHPCVLLGALACAVLADPGQPSHES
eukprot:12486234-Alexandrium_andersonii.AAC.1